MRRIIELTFQKDKKKQILKVITETTAKTIIDLKTKKGWKLIKTNYLINI